MKSVYGGDYDRPTCPVEQVRWDDAQQFLQKLNAVSGMRFRLPTEAEWEYAARAGSTGKYSFGDDEGKLGPPKKAFMSLVGRPSPSSQVASISNTNKGTLPNSSTVVMADLAAARSSSTNRPGQIDQSRPACAPNGRGLYAPSHRRRRRWQPIVVRGGH